MGKLKYSTCLELLLFVTFLYVIGRFLFCLPAQQAVPVAAFILIVTFIWLGYKSSWLTDRLPVYIHEIISP